MRKYIPSLGRKIKKLIAASPYKNSIGLHREIKNRFREEAICLCSLYAIINNNFKRIPHPTSLSQIASIFELTATDLLNGTSKEIFAQDTPKPDPLLSTEPKRLSDEEVNYLRACNDLHLKLGTLDAVGKEIRMTRENVRLTLIKGDRYGLFEYKPTRERIFENLVRKYPNEAAVFEEALKLGGLREFCLSVGLTKQKLNNFLRRLNINKQNFLWDIRKQRCLNDYNVIYNQIGYHPSATIMENKKEWRNVLMRINRIWGSITKFRKDQGIIYTPTSK